MRASSANPNYQTQQLECVLRQQPGTFKAPTPKVAACSKLNARKQTVGLLKDLRSLRKVLREDFELRAFKVKCEPRSSLCVPPAV